MTVHCDNQGTVAVVNSGYSRVPPIMHLLRCLFFIRAPFQINLWATHIPGIENTLADAISRDNLPVLYSQVPESVNCRSPVPLPLISLLSGGFDLSRLDGTVQQQFSSGLTPATRRNYQSGSNRFMNYCSQFGVSSPYPPSEVTFCSFSI